MHSMTDATAVWAVPGFVSRDGRVNMPGVVVVVVAVVDVVADAEKK